MKKLLIYFGKKALMKTLNEFLSENKDKVLVVVQKAALWIERLENIITILKSIQSRVADSKLSDEEVEQTTRDISNLVEKF